VGQDLVLRRRPEPPAEAFSKPDQVAQGAAAGQRTCPTEQHSRNP